MRNKENEEGDESSDGEVDEHFEEAKEEPEKEEEIDEEGEEEKKEEKHVDEEEEQQQEQNGEEDYTEEGAELSEEEEDEEEEEEDDFEEEDQEEEEEDGIVNTDSVLSQGDDREFLNTILKNKHGDVYGSGAWTFLFQGTFFTNAGNLGHANLPEATFDQSGNFFIHSMHVKDFCKVKSVSGKASRSLVWQTARSFYTKPVSLDTVFKDYRAVLHEKRYFINQTMGAMDAKEALRQTINKGDSFELVLPRSLLKELTDFLRILNRNKGYGCCEIGSIGNGWFTTRNIEMLGPRDTRFAEKTTSKSKSKTILPSFGRKKGGGSSSESEESRKVGTLRHSFMFEEYTSRFGSFDGDIQVTVDRPVRWAMNPEDIPPGTEYVDLTCVKQFLTISGHGRITCKGRQRTQLQLQRPFHQYGQILEDGRLSLEQGWEGKSPFNAVLSYLGGRHNNLPHVSNSAALPDAHTSELLRDVIVPFGEQRPDSLCLDASVITKDPPILSNSGKNSTISLVPVLCLSGYLYNLLTLEEHSRVGYSPSEDFSYVYPKPASSIKRNPPSQRFANPRRKRAKLPARRSSKSSSIKSSRCRINKSSSKEGTVGAKRTEKQSKPNPRLYLASANSAISVNSALTQTSFDSSVGPEPDSGAAGKATDSKQHGTDDDEKIEASDDGKVIVATPTSIDERVDLANQEQTRSINPRGRGVDGEETQSFGGGKSKKGRKRTPLKRMKSVNLQDPKFKIDEGRGPAILPSGVCDETTWIRDGDGGKNVSTFIEERSASIDTHRPSQDCVGGNILIILPTKETETSTAAVATSFSNSVPKSHCKDALKFQLSDFPSISFCAMGAKGKEGESGSNRMCGGDVRMDIKKSEAFAMIAFHGFGGVPTSYVSKPSPAPQSLGVAAVVDGLASKAADIHEVFGELSTSATYSKATCGVSHENSDFEGGETVTGFGGRMGDAPKLAPKSVDETTIPALAAPEPAPSSKSTMELVADYEQGDVQAELTKLKTTLEGLRAEEASLKAQLASMVAAEREVQKEMLTVVAETEWLSVQLTDLKSQVLGLIHKVLESTSDPTPVKEKNISLIPGLTPQTQTTKDAMESVHAGLEGTRVTLKSPPPASFLEPTIEEVDSIWGAPPALAAVPVPVPVPVASLESSEFNDGNTDDDVFYVDSDDDNENDNNDGSGDDDIEYVEYSTPAYSGFAMASVAPATLSFDEWIQEELDQKVPPTPFGYVTGDEAGYHPSAFVTDFYGSETSSDGFSYDTALMSWPGSTQPASRVLEEAEEEGGGLSRSEVEQIRACALTAETEARQAEGTHKYLAAEVERLRRICTAAEREAQEKAAEASRKRGAAKRKLQQEAEAAQREVEEKRQDCLEMEKQADDAKKLMEKTQKDAKDLQQQAEQAEFDMVVASSAREASHSTELVTYSSGNYGSGAYVNYRTPSSENNRFINMID